ncbi:MAG: hypothetical protein RLY78_2311 [Pseudomonadota bacterium]|uniref:Glycosyltransferase family 2 protein n=1 Tax=Pseudaquabacterium rugosum TaxID=2984194 RepID=A0ABU9B3F7_9BURK
MSAMISVIIATRDRPQLFGEALASVLAQRDADFELIVVNDGGDERHLPAYQAMWADARARLGERFSVHRLVHRPRGHGQSYSLNYGVSQATGSHVCFLDDDDRWTDDGHLARVGRAVAAPRADVPPADLYMANQEAWRVDGSRVGVLWIGGLQARLQSRGATADADGVLDVTLDDLMAIDGFCHLNALTVRRALWEQIGGMDEGIRWECDREVWLRLVEAARRMRHHPGVMSWHRVPDPTKALNMTTSLSTADKRVLQCLVLDKVLVRARHPAVIAHAREHKAWALKKLAADCAERGDWPLAGWYARQAFGAAPGLKWGLWTLQASLRGLGGRGA